MENESGIFSRFPNSYTPYSPKKKIQGFVPEEGGGYDEPFLNLDFTGMGMSPVINPLSAESKLEKEKKYNAKDWIIGGLEAVSYGLSRNDALKNEQAEAFRMQQREQAPMFYSGYYGNRGETTIGRNQGLIMAEDGAIVRSTNTGLENALVEQGEHLFYPNGTQATVGGEKHSARVVNGQQVGGTRTNLPDGTMIFSDKLKVPNTNKTFASMAKKLGSQIEKYTEITSAVGKRRVDVETAEIMLTRAVRSLDELFQLQQSINGNHGEDYVDTVDSDEAGDMPIAGKGMMYYQGGGGNSNATNPPKSSPPKNYVQLFDNVMKNKSSEAALKFLEGLRREGIDITNESSLRKKFEAADPVNSFITGFKSYNEYFNPDATTVVDIDKSTGINHRFKIVRDYIESPLFASLNIDPNTISIFNTGSFTKVGNTWKIKDEVTADKLFNNQEVSEYEKLYRPMFKFTKTFGKDNPQYNYQLTPTGNADEIYENAPISKVDGWAGDTLLFQNARPATTIPEYKEKKSDEPVMSTAPGSQFQKAKAVEPSKYVGRPFDAMQLLPNVFAMNQNIAPYVTPEVQQLRVSPYEQYVDPWVQDAYTAAMAASSLGADPNAMFINAQQSVDKIQSQKRNQDTQADFQARMQNAQLQRQADLFNQQQLGIVNNQLLNVAKSNKAKSDIEAMQNALLKYQEYAANEANTAMNFPLMSPGYNYNANTGETTVNQSYWDAGFQNVGLTNMDLIQNLTPLQYAELQKNIEKNKEAKKASQSTKTETK